MGSLTLRIDTGRQSFSVALLVNFLWVCRWSSCRASIDSLSDGKLEGRGRVKSPLHHLCTEQHGVEYFGLSGVLSLDAASQTLLIRYALFSTASLHVSIGPLSLTNSFNKSLLVSHFVH